MRDGADLTVDGYDVAPSFSIWRTIEECLNPPVVWEKERGWLVDARRASDVEVSPRDVVAACLPDPAGLGNWMHCTTCAGLQVTGTGNDGLPRSTYLYHVVDNDETRWDYGHQCVVWQTAVNPGRPGASTTTEGSFSCAVRTGWSTNRG